MILKRRRYKCNNMEIVLVLIIAISNLAKIFTRYRCVGLLKNTQASETSLKEALREREMTYDRDVMDLESQLLEREQQVGSFHNQTCVRFKMVYF